MKMIFQRKKKQQKNCVRVVLHSTKLSALNTEIIITTVQSPSFFTLFAFSVSVLFSFLCLYICVSFSPFLVLQSIVIVNVEQHGRVCLPFVCSHTQFRHFFNVLAIVVVAVAVRCMCACEHAVFFCLLRFSALVALFSFQFYLQCVAFLLFLRVFFGSVSVCEQ